MTIETAAHVGPDGRLELNLPTQFADTDVILTVRPANGAPVQRIADNEDPEERRRKWQEWVEQTAGKWEGELERPPDAGRAPHLEESRRFVQRFAGSWQGEPLERAEQGPLQERDELQ